jgi:membrane protease YdiL (CAAX protease family)
VVYIVEVIILYCLLFFQDLSAYLFSPAAVLNETLFEFSINDELFRIFSYNIPIIALLWFILGGKEKIAALHNAPLTPNKSGKVLSYLRFHFPGKIDFTTALFAFLCIIGASIVVTIVSYIFPDAGNIDMPPLTLNIPTMLIIVISSLSTGYAEEGFFRLYLFDRLEKINTKPQAIIIISVLLFSVCHLYEGAMGVLNAALCGLILAIFFYKRRSYHGIAIAHASWNTLVWLFSAIPLS